MTSTARLFRATLAVLPARAKRRLLRNPWREHALCQLLLPQRLQLPTVASEALFPGFDDTEVRLSTLPCGNWAAPLTDLVHLMKLTALLQPRQVLELGSFRGYTALGIASHLADGAKLVAVDIQPEHGEAYRGRPEAVRIERRTGAIGPDVFAQDAPHSFDLIFIDADHRQEAVRHDTETVLPLLAPDGLLIWHDYANWGAFNGACGVPEYLNALQQEIPIVHLAGSNLAVHSPSWPGLDAPPLQNALALTEQWARGGPWHTEVTRS